MSTYPYLNEPILAQQYFEDKLAFTTGPAEVRDWLRNHSPVAVFDVRASKDFQKGHLPGALNLPQEEWEATRDLARDRLNVFYCYTANCHLAARAALHFSRLGYSVLEMDGGIEGWREAGFEIETSPRPEAEFHAPH